ncbi:amidohydrolase family protein [Dyadobacter frigoris]|uniref:Amidohydrolase-related domain-containing protein n=1 Tax=Dyadobacter frigoris TaxID=2576211 RepID=A0A4U6D3A7_9BACT|nr:amidohydrolase family protein [Dyadobacter frigoris]TKT90601.1 hypothetical protein FDK13_19965 [Dyadobacter frigoris]GLU51250.1 hydrolase [Dyadobacter frigoris]
MILNNVRVIENGKMASIKIFDGKIEKVGEDPFQDTDKLLLTFSDAIIFPGLINSHDHLDFNLFAALGDTQYNSYTEWGGYIHKNYKEEIASALKVPFPLRERWGLYKNMLCGVTTVVNHSEKFTDQTELINVIEDFQTLHSVQFEKKWQQKLNNPLKIRQPVVIHTGEGTNQEAHEEITKLIRWNLLKRKLIGVHGVAMSARQAVYFKALVWCPESNYFLLNKTARIKELKKHTAVLFGSDSTLTGSWNIWDHMRLARKTSMLTDSELYQSLTGTAADVWKLNTGKITEGFDADLVVARQKRNDTDWDTFYNLNPEDILLVIHKGKIRLFDASLFEQLPNLKSQWFSKIYLGDRIKYVQGDLADLVGEIKKYKPDASFPMRLSANNDSEQ